MKGYSSKTNKIIRNVCVVSVICIISIVSLHKTSNMFKNAMFTHPNKLEEWDDHIQIAMILKGKYSVSNYCLH